MRQKYAEKYYKGKQGLDCYLKLTQAWGYQLRNSIDDNNIARRIAEEAMSMCPETPAGYSRLGWIYFFDYMMGNTKSPRETFNKAIELAEKAVAMDDSFSDGHALLSTLYPSKKEYDKAIDEGERGVTLDPGATAGLAIHANSLSVAGCQRKPFRYSKKLSDSTPLVHPIYITVLAWHSGKWGGLKRRFRHGRKQFSLRLITFMPILA